MVYPFIAMALLKIILIAFLKQKELILLKNLTMKHGLVLMKV